MTINATAPCRIDDIGGWTDTWFAHHGAVFSMAINPGAVVQIKTVEHPGVCINLENYHKTWTLDNSDFDECHPFIAEAIRCNTCEDDGMEIHVQSDMPPGASTGTSAAVIVALCAALARAMMPERDYYKSVQQLALHAHNIETRLGFESGIQDQVAAANGGINLIEISPYPKYSVESCKPDGIGRAGLENRLMLVYIGKPHMSSEIHKRVIASLGEDPQDSPLLKQLRVVAYSAMAAMYAHEFVILGQYMDANTAILRRMHADLVCDAAEEVIDIADKLGALGCKVNGAGGDGGSLTILTDGSLSGRIQLRERIKQAGYEVIPISLNFDGVKVWEG